MVWKNMLFQEAKYGVDLSNNPLHSDNTKATPEPRRVLFGDTSQIISRKTGGNYAAL